MNEQNIKILKKQIIYRCSHTGTKETDLYYKKKILNKLDNFTFSELLQISNIFKNLSDPEIYNILSGKIDSPSEYRGIFKKIINA